MATQYESQRNQLVNLQEELAGIDPQNLIRRDLGEFAFNEALPTFEAIKGFFTFAKAVDWEGVPAQTLSQLFQNAMSLKSQIANIQTFSALRPVGGNSPQQLRNNLAAGLESVWQGCFSTFVPPLAFQYSVDAAKNCSSQGEEYRAEFDALLEVARRETERLKGNAESLKQSTVELTQKAEQVLDSARKAAAESGVTQQAGHFKELAHRYFSASLVWLGFAIAFFVATIVYVVDFANPAPTNSPTIATHGSPATLPTNAPAPPIVSKAPDTTSQAGQTTTLDVASLIRSMLPRLVTITLLLTGLVFCLRNFAAMAHNQVVNQHRQTALTTFQTFVGGSADQQTKNAVLLQATQAIFLPQPSGYLKGDNDIPQVNQFIDVVRSVTTKKES